MVYLDNAATTLKKPPGVAYAMERALKEYGSPGRGGHDYAVRAAETAFKCRERASELFNVHNPENVVFTFNATHGLNIAVNSVVSPGDRVVVTGFEHNSVIRPLVQKRAVIVPVVKNGAPGDDFAERFEKTLTPDTTAVFLTHVSNAFGFVFPAEETADICRKYGIPLIIDASQSAGSIKLDMERLGAAFIAMPGHKGLYGPQGTGLLLCGIDPRPYMSGGSGSDSRSDKMPQYLPDMLEAGTHNMPGIAGLSEGLRFVSEKGTERILKHERALISMAVSGLEHIPGVDVYCNGSENHGGVLSFNVDGLSSEETAARLNKIGYALRAGLHCAPYAHKAMGTIDDGTVRISVSAFTTKKEIDGFLNAIKFISSGR